MSDRDRAEWSIQQVAKLAGTASRTLRHYDEVGLVPPTRVGDNGYRYYDADALVRLQRVLLLRDLGLGIPAIAGVLSGRTDDARALGAHLGWLAQEKERLDRQIASVEHTITEIEEGRSPMAEQMFDGFDHTEYEEEVATRWGADAYASGDAWWTSRSAVEQAAFRADAAQLAADWAAAAAAGEEPGGEAGQRLAQRQYDWLSSVPDVPRASDGRLDPGYLTGLGEMYVADDRFAKNYGGATGAAFVRDALAVYAERTL